MRCLPFVISGAAALAGASLALAQPVNDHCASATAIGAGLVFHSTTEGATSDLAQSPCSILDAFDVWYRFTASVDGEHVIAVSSPHFLLDTTVAVYNSCTTAGLNVAIGCNDDGDPYYGTDSLLAMTLFQGQSIIIRVAGYIQGAGPFDIVIAPPPSATGTGACCHGTSCVVVLAADCMGPNTRFAGLGATCNPSGNTAHPCCRADFDQNGHLSLEDVFHFIDAWLTSDPSAQFVSNGLTLQDIFSFLDAWFAGC